MYRPIVTFLLVLLLAGWVGIPCHALTLQEGLAIIASEGWEVKIAEMKQVAAEQTVSLSRSKLLPEVDIYADHTWLAYQPEANFGVGATAPIADKASLSYGLVVRQLIYDFGKTGSSVDAARFSAQSKSLNTSLVKNLVVRDFLLNFITLLESERLLDVAKEEVKQFDAHLADTREMYSEGLVTVSDVLQAEVLASDAKQRRVSAENNRALLAARINTLLLRPLSSEVKIEEGTIPEIVPDTDVDSAWRSAENSRTELQVIRSRIEAENARIKSFRAESYPRLYLNGGYDYTENQYMVHEENWNLTAGLSMNIYSGGETKAAVGRANAELNSLLLEEAKMRDSIRLEVENAVLLLQSARERFKVTRKGVDQARENLRLQKLRYEEGEAAATDVQDAVTLLAQVEQNYWMALYGVQKGNALVLYSQGKDLEEEYSR
jgi:outer membrane protein TolC